MEDHKRLNLRVDHRPAIEDHITDRVNVVAPVYVGGLPPHYETQSAIVSNLSNKEHHSYHRKHKFNVI